MPMADLVPFRSAALGGMRRWLSSLLAAIALVATVGGVADAKITIRPGEPSDTFFFHGNYSSVPFDPASGFGIRIWNCPDGTPPTLLSQSPPLVICELDPTGIDHVLAELVYEVNVPPGTCNDHGSSCYFRDRSVSAENPGLRYFRVRYANQGRGNRVWLESYGDLSAARHPDMMVVITIDGLPRALLDDAFRPLRNGGWFSPF
jgi:hypothetical protein